MRLTHAAIVIPIFVLLALGPHAVAAAPPAEPCSQVTAAQVSTALGETVGEGQKSNTVTCTWIADKPKHQVVTVMYSPPGDWDRRKRPMPGVTKTNVPGLGDDAMAETAANFTTLYVKKGTTTFMVRVYGIADPARQLAIEQPIAQAVAAKL